MKDDLTASRKVQKAAQKIVEYLEHDEFRGYCEELMNGESDCTHIWLAVRTLRDWLGMPPEYEDEVKRMHEDREYFKEHRADTAA